MIFTQIIVYLASVLGAITPPHTIAIGETSDQCLSSSIQNAGNNRYVYCIPDAAAFNYFPNGLPK